MEIEIITTRGKEKIPALPTSHPSVAVHLTQFDTDGKKLALYGVTHVPSGYAFINCLPNAEIAVMAAEWYIAQGLNLDGGKAEIEASATKEFKDQHRVIRMNLDLYAEGLNEILFAFGVNGFNVKGPKIG